MNMTLKQSIIATIITFILIAVTISLVGCTTRGSAALYWPWENGDDIYKSREAENTWGHGTLK